MSETIDEAVSVDLLSNHLKRTSYPWAVHWRGKRFHITQVGLHHLVREGSVLHHVFSVSDGNTFLKLQLNTETLAWRLLEVDTV